MAAVAGAARPLSLCSGPPSATPRTGSTLLCSLTFSLSRRRRAVGEAEARTSRGGSRGGGRAMAGRRQLRAWVGGPGWLGGRRIALSSFSPGNSVPGLVRKGTGQRSSTHYGSFSAKPVLEEALPFLSQYPVRTVLCTCGQAVAGLRLARRPACVERRNQTHPKRAINKMDGSSGHHHHQRSEIMLGSIISLAARC